MEDDGESLTTLARPSSGRYHGISHIFSKHFGKTFQEDAIDPEKIKYLETSRGSRDTYHEKYVAELIKVTEERQKRLKKCNDLEKSIIQAQAKALMIEQREMARLQAHLGTVVRQDERKFSKNTADTSEEEPTAETMDKDQKKVTLPPRSYLRDTLDSRLLQENGLLCPLDVTRRVPPLVPPPKSRKVSESGAKSPINGKSRLAKSPSLSSISASGSAQNRSASANSNRNSFLEDIDMDNYLEEMCASECSSEENRGFNSAKSQQNLQLPPIKGKRQKRRQSVVEVCWGKPGNWKEHMNSQQREVARRHLSQMNARVNFLKNPRFFLPWETDGNGLLIDPEAKKPIIFDIKPNPVVFTEYKIDQVYEIRVKVTNITASMRTIRVIPPATKHFSVGLGQFPGERGLIAPGLCCEYPVRFAPDSLGDFADQMTLETQDKSHSLVISLSAQRKRPSLSVSDVWDIGYCLVDGQKTARWQVKNFGGHGRFVLIAEENWPTTNFQSAIRQGAMLLDPFIIYPDYMELSQGEVGTFNIVFLPQTVGLFERRFHILCDNCHMQPFTLRGLSEVANLELISADEGLDDWRLDEIHDITAQTVLRFSEMHPYTMMSRTISVKNNCHIDIPFAWKIVKPLFSEDNPLNWSADQQMGEEDDNKAGRSEPLMRHRILDVTSPFSVTPPQGILRGDYVTTFTIIFAPTEIGKYISSMHLVMKDIPDSLPATLAASFIASGGSASINAISTPFSVSPSSPTKKSTDLPIERVNGASAGDVGPNNQGAADTTGGNGSYSQQRVMVLSDVPELEVEARGECIPLRVGLHPAAVVVMGKILVGTPTRRQVTLTNYSSCAISFYWQELLPPLPTDNGKESVDTDFSNDPGQSQTHKEHVTNKALLEVQPSFGQLAGCDVPHMNSINLDVCITGTGVGCVRTNLCCYVEHLETPLFLPVEAVVQGPELFLEETNINFGLVRMGESQVKFLHIRNPSSIPCSWTLHVATSRDPQNIDELTFSIVEGTIRALDTQEVAIEYRPKAPKTLDTELEIRTQYGDTRCIQLFGIGQNPTVVLAESLLTSTELFYRMTARHHVTLQNLTAMDASFCWISAFGSDAASIEVSLEPQKGVIPPRGSFVAEISLTPKALVTIKELLVPCLIEGQEEPLILSVEGVVQDLSVQLSVSHDISSPLSAKVLNESSPLIDFGENIALWSVVTRYLHITNPTAIPTSFHLSVDYFSTPKPLQDKNPHAIKDMSSMPPAIGKTHSAVISSTTHNNSSSAPLTVDVAEDTRSLPESSSSKRVSLLKKTPNLADPRSKPAHLSHYDYCKRMLGEKKGLAFHCFPQHGNLPPHSTVTIELNAFNDMWGDYEDVLVCQVGYLDPIPIKMRIHVVGCPVAFTMTAGREGHLPITRFGSHTAGSETITRPVRLNNKSPFWLRIDWQLYQVRPHDDKLLDLCIGFGQVFPALDANGDEIPPNYKPDTTPLKLSTKSLDMPATDSPDSTDRSTSKLSKRMSQLIPPREIFSQAGTYFQSNTEEGFDTVRTDLDVSLSDRLWPRHDSYPNMAATQRSKRPKLVHLFLRPHDGELNPTKISAFESDTGESQTKSPQFESAFSIEPKQLWLPPESYAISHVQFHPAYECPWRDTVLQEQRSQKGGLLSSSLPLNGYALGFISVDEERAHVPGKCRRAEHYHIEQLRMELSGSIDEPELEITNEEDENDIFHIEGSFSELLPNNWRELDPAGMEKMQNTLFPAQPSTSFFNETVKNPQSPNFSIKQKSISKICHGLLRNYKETNLSFELTCPSPFQLIQPRPKPIQQSPNTLKSMQIDTEKLSMVQLILKPRETCQMEMAFHISPKLLAELHDAPDYNEEDVQPCYRRRIPAGKVMEEELLIQGSLKIRFSNGRTQYQGIITRIRFPAFHLSNELCDFGPCFISQTRELQVFIKNPTSSNCVWRAVADSTEEIDNGIFRVTPTHGFLESSDVPTSQSKCLIRIFFTPKDMTSYEVKLTFYGILGEQPQHLCIRGSGSYDGQYQEIYNE